LLCGSNSEAERKKKRDAREPSSDLHGATFSVTFSG